MDIDQTAAIVSALAQIRWPDNAETATEALRVLGFTVQPGAGTTLTGGSVQHGLEPPPGIDHATLTTAEGEAISIGFFIATDPEPHSVATVTTHRNLLTALTETFGPPEQVWADQPTPVHWRGAEVDVSVQLFDRRDSTVMVWVEHRSLSQAAESDAE